MYTVLKECNSSSRLCGKLAMPFPLRRRSDAIRRENHTTLPLYKQPDSCHYSLHSYVCAPRQGRQIFDLKEILCTAHSYREFPSSLSFSIELLSYFTLRGGRQPGNCSLSSAGVGHMANMLRGSGVVLLHTHLWPAPHPYISKEEVSNDN